MLSQAPTRVDWAGPWTDVPQYTVSNQGATCNAAITVFSNVEATLNPKVSGPSRKYRGDNSVTLTSEDLDTTFTTGPNQTIHEIEVDSSLSLAQSVLKRLEIKTGLTIITDSQAPPGCGLGTSSSMAVAIIEAVSRLFKIEMTSKKIIDLARTIETEDLGILGGWQDYYAAVYGGFGYMKWNRNLQTHRYIKVSPKFIQELQERSLLVYSGKSRLSGNIYAHVNRSLASDPSVKTAFSQMAKQAYEARTALERGDIELLAEIVNRSWECQKMLHPTVTNDDIDQMMEIALANGAMAGKACGAGGGGCLLFLTGPGAKEEVARALSEVLSQIGGHIIPFEFDLEGVRIVKAN